MTEQGRASEGGPSVAHGDSALVDLDADAVMADGDGAGGASDGLVCLAHGLPLLVLLGSKVISLC